MTVPAHARDSAIVHIRVRAAFGRLSDSHRPPDSARVTQHTAPVIGPSARRDRGKHLATGTAPVPASRVQTPVLGSAVNTSPCAPAARAIRKRGARRTKSGSGCGSAAAAAAAGSNSPGLIPLWQKQGRLRAASMGTACVRVAAKEEEADVRRREPRGGARRGEVLPRHHARQGEGPLVLTRSARARSTHVSTGATSAQGWICAAYYCPLSALMLRPQPENPLRPT